MTNRLSNWIMAKVSLTANLDLPHKKKLFKNKNSEQSVQDILRRYDQYLESPTEKMKREFRKDDISCDWEKIDKPKFVAVVDRYGYGPTANRKIAEEVGNLLYFLNSNIFFFFV